MSEFKHTPGRWETNPLNFRNSIRIFAGAKYIGSIGNSDDDQEITKANAKLIAAAPDLLQELINITKAQSKTWYDPEDFEIWAKSRAHAAIEKATGES